MTPTPSIMSLDVGSRRIGVAIASQQARIAQPLLTIDRLKHPDAIAKILMVFEQYAVDTIIVGLPRDMESQETAQTASARAFAADLEKASGLALHLQDEAATSIKAEDELKSRNKPYQKGDIDKLAAAIILSDWLAENVVEKKS